jgi:iron complex transport system substrate-binding protein
MRIVSLLPSATEIVYSLGLGDNLVGVSSDCDHPPEALDKPVVSSSSLDLSDGDSPAAIDSLVRASMSVAEPIYRLDRELIRGLRPDLILAQDLCRVCAVPSGHVTEALESLGCSADVISLDPSNLSDILSSIEDVARVAGVDGYEVIRSLRARIDVVSDATNDLEPVPVLALEWAEPPFTGGHWIPEMVRLAGGNDVLGIEGVPSRTCTWEEIRAAEPEVIVFMPCGYGLEDALEQAGNLARVPSLATTPAAKTGNVWAVDGSSYFSRPGPRLVDGLEILAWILHPRLFPEPPPGRVARVTM